MAGKNVLGSVISSVRFMNAVLISVVVFVKTVYSGIVQSIALG